MNEHLKEGRAFLKTAKSLLESKRFNLSVAQDVCAMAGEKIIVGVLASFGRMPEGHTYTELVSELDRYLTLTEEMKGSLLDLDSYQNLCSMEPSKVPEANEGVIKKAIEVIEAILRMHENKTNL